MTDAGKQILQMMTAAASILLMGACGVQLWFRLTRLMRGQETADGLAKKQSSIPLRRMAWAAGIALLSRLAAMLLAYGFYRVLGVGELSFAGSFEQLWLHWDTRHYIGIAQDGYTAVGDERLRLVFFPLYPLLMRLVSPLTGGNLFAAGTAVSLACSAAAAALLPVRWIAVPLLPALLRLLIVELKMRRIGRRLGEKKFGGTYILYDFWAPLGGFLMTLSRRIRPNKAIWR